MDKYLLNTTLVFRVPTVEDALTLREELENGDYGELIAYSYKTKQIKAKGEEYQVVNAKIDFTPEKEPELKVNVSFEEA